MLSVIAALVNPLPVELKTNPSPATVAKSFCSTRRFRSPDESLVIDNA
jgi:hypothetical protein